MLVSRIKNALVPPGSRARTVRSGAFKGLRMHLDLQHQTQNYLGLYERELHPAIARLSRNAMTALDVGAADGCYALYFLARTTTRRVLAFEPDDRARSLMRRNLQLNGFGEDERVRLIDRAVGQRGAGCIALDDLLAAIQGPVVSKVDVEGAEAEVLRGAATLLEQGRVGWLIETHAASLESECLELLRRHGYRPAVVPPAWWRAIVPEARPIVHNRWIVAPAPRPDSR